MCISMQHRGTGCRLNAAKKSWGSSFSLNPFLLSICLPFLILFFPTFRSLSSVLLSSSSLHSTHPTSLPPSLSPSLSLSLPLPLFPSPLLCCSIFLPTLANEDHGEEKTDEKGDYINYQYTQFGYIPFN